MAAGLSPGAIVTLEQDCVLDSFLPVQLHPHPGPLCWHVGCVLHLVGTVRLGWLLQHVPHSPQPGCPPALREHLRGRLVPREDRCPPATFSTGRPFLWSVGTQSHFATGRGATLVPVPLPPRARGQSGARGRREDPGLTHLPTRSSCAERDEWHSCLSRAVPEDHEAQALAAFHHSAKVSGSRKTGPGSGACGQHADLRPPQLRERLGVSLGERPPVLVPVTHALMCMNCGCDFSLTLRRHHCHACGKVSQRRRGGTAVGRALRRGKGCGVGEAEAPAQTCSAAGAAKAGAMRVGAGPFCTSGGVTVPHNMCSLPLACRSCAGTARRTSTP